MNLQDHISQLSDRYGIPSQLTFALAAATTGMDTETMVFEPTHRWLWDCYHEKRFRNLTDDETLSCISPADFHGCHLSLPDTELLGQKTAWGPFALMGSDARAAGLKGSFLTLCNDPKLTVHYTLVHLTKLRDKYFEKHGWGGVMAAYDAGRPRKDEKGQYIDHDFLRLLSQNGAKGLINYS